MNARSFTAATLSLLAIAGCDDDPVAPATTGRVTVETVTTGASLDADGFLVFVAGGPGEAIAPNAIVTVSDVAVGVQTVELAEVAPNCTVAGQNPREVTVTAGKTTAVLVEVSCEGVGSVEIRTMTGGFSLDADGYEVTVAGGAGMPVMVNGVLNLDFVEPGTWSVELKGWAANCSVVGENPRDVTVSVDAVTPTEFTLTCEAAGSLVVTTATAGVAVDIDGYAVSVAAGAGGSIGYDGTIRLDYLAVGNHVVELSEVASNCVVSGGNPRSVTVELDAVSAIRFDVSCSAPYLGRIVVLSDRGGGDGLYDIVLVDEDGSETASPTPVRNAYAYPTLSPDGTRVAFVQSYAEFGSDVFVMNVDGSGLVNVTGNNGVGPEATHPSWSPQGTRLLFATDRFGDWDLYGVDPDGSNLTPVLVAPGLQWEGSWSPDGTRILFTGKGGDVWVANADGSGQTNLTNWSTSDLSYLAGPAWSPDGGRIALVRSDDAEPGIFVVNIYVMNADGSGRTNLTGSDSDFDFAPSWSPDGTRILFATVRDGDLEAYVMNADGSGPTNLTSSPGSRDLPGSPQGWR